MTRKPKLDRVRRRLADVRTLLGVDQRLWTATQFLQASARSVDPAASALLREVAHEAMPRPSRRATLA